MLRNSAGRLLAALAVSAATVGLSPTAVKSQQAGSVPSQTPVAPIASNADQTAAGKALEKVTVTGYIPISAMVLSRSPVITRITLANPDIRPQRTCSRLCQVQRVTGTRCNHRLRFLARLRLHLAQRTTTDRYVGSGGWLAFPCLSFSSSIWRAGTAQLRRFKL